MTKTNKTQLYLGAGIAFTFIGCMMFIAAAGAMLKTSASITGQGATADQANYAVDKTFLVGTSVKPIAAVDTVPANMLLGLGMLLIVVSLGIHVLLYTDRKKKPVKKNKKTIDTVALKNSFKVQNIYFFDGQSVKRK